MGDVDVWSIKSSVYPQSAPTSGTIGTRRLEGRSNPTSVNSKSTSRMNAAHGNTWSKFYFSRLLHELTRKCLVFAKEAMAFERAALRIFCRTTSRGPNGHYCSVGFRIKALFPYVFRSSSYLSLARLLYVDIEYFLEVHTNTLHITRRLTVPVRE